MTNNLRGTHLINSNVRSINIMYSQLVYSCKITRCNSFNNKKVYSVITRSARLLASVHQYLVNAKHDREWHTKVNYLKTQTFVVSPRNNDRHAFLVMLDFPVRSTISLITNQGYLFN